MANNKIIIFLCHDPTSFVAPGRKSLFASHKIYAFPENVDAQNPQIDKRPGCPK